MATDIGDDKQGSMAAGFNPVSYAVGIALDLKLVIGFVIVTLAFIDIPALHETIARPALGLALVLFVPGYAMVAALFPGIRDLDGIERATFSFGLSIAVTPLIGLGLNYTPWGIRLDPILVCLSIFIIICTLIANKRRHELNEDERFSIDFAKLYGQFRNEAFAVDKTRFDKALTIILIISILLSAATVAYVVVVPRNGEKFTEFYILGPDGKADNYPADFILGDQKPIVVGVADHEHRNVTYDLVVELNDSVNVTRSDTEQLTLMDGQTWEKTIDLTPDRPGTGMKMEFLLYADGNMTAPYRECHLWVNVTAPQ